VYIKDCIKAAENLNEELLTQLRHTYEGKCFAGSRIIRILNLKSADSFETSPLICISTITDDGSGDVDVRFEAEAIILEPGEILNNCVIAPTKERRGIIHLEHEHATVVIKGDSNLSLKAGQIVSCKVEKSDCNPLSGKINVIASLNLKYDHPIIKASSDFDPTKTKDYEAIQKIIEHINSLNYIDDKTAARRKFFTQFLIPENTNDFKVKGRYKLLGGKYIIQKDRYYRSILGDTAEVIIEEVMVDEDIEGAAVIGSMTGSNLVYKFLSAYYNTAYTIKSMMEIYPETDDETNSNLWEIYS
jgi:hypothetical protein